MNRRYFIIIIRGAAVLELDQQVIDAVDDEWRKYLYDLHSPEEIAEMVGRCMMTLGTGLSNLDGWADQPDENARLLDGPEWEAERVVEISAADFEYIKARIEKERAAE